MLMGNYFNGLETTSFWVQKSLPINRMKKIICV